MSHTPVRCEHDGIKWFPRSTVEKYSPDQSAWAERKLREELSWGRRLLVETLGIRVPRLHGSWLREAFPAGPEDGFAYTQGNILVNGGLDKLAAILVAATPTSLLPFAQAICGVGSGTTAAAVTQPALIADGTTPNGSTGAWYRQMDTSFPAVDGTVHGQLDGQATYGGTEANLNWQEWCWASTTTGTITAGATLASVSSGTETMFNRWTGTSLGTKGSGATWVFSTTITFSLYPFVPSSPRSSSCRNTGHERMEEKQLQRRQRGVPGVAHEQLQRPQQLRRGGRRGSGA